MFLKDLFYPKVCLGCGMLGSYICLRCRSKLSYIEKDRCLYCNRLSLFGLTHPICRRQYGLDGIISIFFYNSFLQKIIKTVKYRLALDVWEDLARTIEPRKMMKLSFFQKAQRELGLLYLQSIPLHPQRLKSRGFNQAHVIAEFFQSFLDFPISNVLSRTRPTQPQAELKKGKERFLNIRGAFEIKKSQSVFNTNYLLVDDVVTTGSTVKEAASVLRRSGARRVFALTLAKG